MISKADERELMRLLEAIACDTIDDRGVARLESILLADPHARTIYRQYVNAHIGLKQYLTACSPEPSHESSPVLGFLGSGAARFVDFCWSALPFSILVAVGLPLLCVVLLAVGIRRPEVAPRPHVANTVCVARLSGVSKCVWDQRFRVPSDGEPLTVGRRLNLLEGLAEITMANGTTVVVEGPSRITIDSDRTVALDNGKLTALVPKPVKGFTVRTPRLSVVDLGTEFGVHVSGDEQMDEIEVFQGEVQLETPRQENTKPTIHRRLAAGRAVRVKPASRRSEVAIQDIAATSTRFVRTLPRDSASPKKPPTPSIVANFSGGAGKDLPDQFPGSVGSGWTAGWRVAPAEGVETRAVVERSDPLLGKGDYVKFLATRPGGNDAVRTALVRVPQLDGPVDMKKPHVVAFDLRIDRLEGFRQPFDNLTVCSNSVSHEELTKVPSGGWHIRVSGGDRESKRKLTWDFYDGNGRGQSRPVDSGIVVRPGVVYSFRVLVEPGARRWTPSVSVNGGPAKKFSSMGMRSSGTAETRGYWPFLHFRACLAGNRKAGERQTVAFSLDSLQITPANAQERRLSPTTGPGGETTR